MKTLVSQQRACDKVKKLKVQNMHVGIKVMAIKH
jgi:hypothetical protein